MAKITKRAEDLILDAVEYLNMRGYEVDIPDIKWRIPHDSDVVRFNKTTNTYQPIRRKHSSGVCYPNHITICAGSDPVDLKLVILHELTHWALPITKTIKNKKGRPLNRIKSHQGHTPEFWDLAWSLFRHFKLPARYCLKREGNYMKGATAAYHRSSNKKGK